MLWLLFSGDLWVSSFVFILPLWEHACFSLAMFIERNKSTNVNSSATNKVSTNWVNIFNRTFMSSVNFFKVVNQIDVRRPRTSASMADVILIMLTSTIKLRHLRLLIFKWCNNGRIFLYGTVGFWKERCFLLISERKWPMSTLNCKRNNFYQMTFNLYCLRLEYFFPKAVFLLIKFISNLIWFVLVYYFLIFSFKYKNYELLYQPN